MEFLRSVFRKSRLKKPAPHRLGRFASRASFHFEPLEERKLLTASPVYFDSQWALVTDVSPSGLSVGDLVNDGNSGNGSIAAEYGVNAFGSVVIGGTPTSLSGSATVNDAIAATTSGGVVNMLSNPAGGTIDIDSPILLSGGFTLPSGNLELSDPDGAISLGATPSTIALTSGNLDLSGGVLSLGVDSSGQNDQIEVNGTVNLSGVELVVHFGQRYAPTNTQYTIIENDGSDAVVGTFASLPEGANLMVGERTVRISYTGGTGNDVVLTVLAAKNPFSSYVNDNWYGTLSPGYFVDNSLDIDEPYVSRSYQDPTEVNGFQSAAYDLIQDAVDATAPGGVVNILTGSYTENVTISKRLVVNGSFELNGSLTINDAAVTLLTGEGVGTISVGDLELSPRSTLKLKANPSDSDLLEVNGDLNLGGAQLDLMWLGEATGNITLIENDGVDAITGTFAGLPEGGELLIGEQRFWITYAGGDGNDVELVIPDSSIEGRHIFYNQSNFDGNTSGVSTSDDAAIATDKSALLPGQTATFANLTSFTRGINGIMVDIAGSHPNISADDFFFQVGSNNSPHTWATAPAPATVSVRSGAGVNGSDRVEIIWANNDIQNQWLKVNVLSTIDTGLAVPDVFYFGNRIGDTGLGNSSVLAVTNSADEIAIRNNVGGPVPITNAYDVTRDKFVTSGDELASRNNVGTLALIKAPGALLIDSVSGPMTWIVGQEVTLVSTLPKLPSGTVDPNVTSVNLYQDINGNGILDGADVLLATGSQVLDANSDPIAWSILVDPEDVDRSANNGNVACLVVVGTSGALVTAEVLQPTVVDPGVNNANDEVILNFVEVLGQDLKAQAYAVGEYGGGGNLVYGATGLTVATGRPTVVNAQSGGFSLPDGVATSAGYAYNAFSEGSIGQVMAEAITEAGATALGTTVLGSAARAGFFGSLRFQIDSPNAPIGTPVIIMYDVAAMSFDAGIAAGASTAMINRVAIGPTQLFWNYNYVSPFNYTSTIIREARVGDTVDIYYYADTEGLGAHNISMVSVPNPPYMTGERISVAKLNIAFKGL